MNIPDGAKPALITVVYDPNDEERPWKVEDNRQPVRNETRHASKGGVLERMAEILDSMVQ
jgi:hypothetical protein